MKDYDFIYYQHCNATNYLVVLRCMYLLLLWLIG